MLVVGVFFVVSAWLGFVSVSQAGESVFDSFVIVRFVFGQVDYFVVQDEVSYFVFGYGDQVGYVWVGWVGQQEVGSVAVWFKQDRCGGYGYQVWELVRVVFVAGGVQVTWRSYLLWKAMILVETLVSFSSTLGRVGWNMYRLCWAFSGFQGKNRLWGVGDWGYDQFYVRVVDIKRFWLGGQVMLSLFFTGCF